MSHENIGGLPDRKTPSCWPFSSHFRPFSGFENWSSQFPVAV